MSTILYDIRLEEEYHGSNNTYRHETRNLPHFSQLKTWLPKEWDDCNIPSVFDGVLKNKITACPMTIFQKPDGTAIARIHIHFVPGFRLTKARREECFEQLDDQMTDGCVLKAGNTEMVNHYMKFYGERIRQIIPEDPPEITIIEFSNFQILSPDDICTLLNYFLNHIPYDRILEILSMPEDTLREKIASLQKCGF